MSNCLRVLPHDTAAERGVLGCVLRDGRIAPAARDLQAGDFYWPAHAAIWRAMLKLDYRDEPITAPAVYQELCRCGEDRLLPHGSSRVN